MSNVLGIRLLVLSACLVIPCFLAGQSKIAIINLQRAVLETAEIKKASTDLEAKYKPKQERITALQTDLQNIERRLRTEADKLTPQQQNELALDGQRKQRDLQRMTEDLQAEVERERNDILTRSSQKMQEVVQKLSEQNGYDVVVDISNTVYFKPALEITNEAIAAYDKAPPAK